MATSPEIASDIYDISHTIVKELQDNINSVLDGIKDELVSRDSGLDLTYLAEGKGATAGVPNYIFAQDIQLEDIGKTPPTNFPLIRVVPQEESIAEPSGNYRKAVTEYDFKIRSYVHFPYVYDNDASATDSYVLGYGTAIFQATALVARAVREVLVTHVKGKSGIYLVRPLRTRYSDVGFMANLNIFVKPVDMYVTCFTKSRY